MGTGGNEHAKAHYEATNLPLAVKLGTITAEGQADVYSYPEGNMVRDPWLEQHLVRWGIEMGRMRKTERTMAELEVDLQYNYEYERIQEQGQEHQPLFGPGFTGLTNLGIPPCTNTTERFDSKS